MKKVLINHYIYIYIAICHDLGKLELAPCLRTEGIGELLPSHVVHEGVSWQKVLKKRRPCQLLIFVAGTCWSMGAMELWVVAD